MLKRILNRNEEEVNELITPITAIYMGLFLIIYFLNISHVFSLSIVKMNLLLIWEFVTLVIPIFLLYITKYNGPKLKYVFVTSFSLAVGGLFSVLTFYVTLMFVFPLIIASLYFNRQLIIFTMVEEGIILILANFIGKKVRYDFVNPYEKGTLEFFLTGFLPMALILAFCFIGIFVLTNRSATLLNRDSSNEMTVEELKNDTGMMQQEVIKGLAIIAEQYESKLGEHIQRIKEYMYIMMKGYNFYDNLCQNVSLACMIHDIGKISLPKELIQKEGKYTPEEYKLMQTHVDIGYNLLKNVPGEIIGYARDIILDHHENYDGTGYYSKKEKQIDLYARILRVVDVFDALLSEKTYKRKWSLISAYEKILEGSGKEFDPQAVEVFKNNFNDIANVYKKYQNIASN